MSVSSLRDIQRSDIDRSAVAHLYL